MLSEPEFIALNAIFLKKMATEATIAHISGFADEQVRQCVATAADRGWLLNLPDGAMLLEAGTQQVIAHYQKIYASTRADPEVLKWYENFEVLNAHFIAAVSDWQRSEGDERFERRLLQAVERLVNDIGQLLPAVPRYGGYVRRFEHGIEQVDLGQREFVCKPTIDSVHSIWFEFHEDILAVLGRPRDTT